MTPSRGSVYSSSRPLSSRASAGTLCAPLYCHCYDCYCCYPYHCRYYTIVVIIVIIAADIAIISAHLNSLFQCFCSSSLRLLETDSSNKQSYCVPRDLHITALIPHAAHPLSPPSAHPSAHPSVHPSAYPSLCSLSLSRCLIPCADGQRLPAHG